MWSYFKIIGTGSIPIQRIHGNISDPVLNSQTQAVRLTDFISLRSP